MGYNSLSLIVDADGKQIVQIGSGASREIVEQEEIARIIVCAVNAYKG